MKQQHMRWIGILVVLALMIALVPAAVLAADTPAANASAPQQEAVGQTLEIGEGGGPSDAPSKSPELDPINPPENGITPPVKETKPVVVTAFDAPEPATYEISAGEELPALPETLQAAGADGEQIVIEGVTWAAETFDASAPGEYVFTAKLPEGYEIAPDAKLPQLTVKVAQGPAIVLMASEGDSYSGGVMTLTDMTGGDLENKVQALEPADLTNITGLTVIGGTMNATDFAFLSNLTGLSNLDLSGADVTGNLSALNGLAGLISLDLSNSIGIKGEITELDAAVGLKYLDLSGTYVTGNILALNGLTALEYIDLSSLYGKGVDGDISALNGMDGLKHLDLNSADVDGDISALSGKTALEYVDLFQTNAEGELSGLKDLSGMKTLNLGVTNVTGDIEDLSGMTGLTNLDLYNTEAEGDIAVLKGMKDLSSIDLGGTNVSGSIDDLAKLGKLEALRLSPQDGTKLTGDISSLKEMTGLEELDLYGTSVTGDIAALEKVKKLTSIFLSGTGVCGDFSKIDLTNAGSMGFADLKIKLPQATFAGQTLSVPIPVKNGAAFPVVDNLAGAAGAAQGGSMVWNAPAAPTGKLTYHFTMEIKAGYGGEATGTVEQPYTTQYTILATAGTGGSISPGGDVGVLYGKSQGFTFKPNTDYELDTVKVDGSTITVSNNQYTFTDVSKNHTIQVTFKKKSGPDTPTGGPDTPTGGPDTPTGGPDTPTGGPDTPTGGPDTPTGGPDTPTGDPGTLPTPGPSSVPGGQPTSSSDGQGLVYLEASAGPGGKISAQGRIGVKSGDSYTFYFTPNTGYHTYKVLVDGKEVKTNGNKYTFEHVSEPHTIYVTFADGSVVSTGDAQFTIEKQEPTPSGQPTPTPTATAAPASPKTGDESNMALWIVLVCAAGTLVMAAAAYRRKKMRNQ